MADVREAGPVGEARVRVGPAASVTPSLQADDGEAPAWLGGVVDVLGATGAVVCLLSDDRQALEPRWWVGYPRQVIESWRRIPLAFPTPLTDALAGDGTVVVASPQQRAADYPQLAHGEAPTLLAAVALRDRQGAPVGVLGVSFPDALPDDTERLLLGLAGRLAGRIHGVTPAEVGEYPAPGPLLAALDSRLVRRAFVRLLDDAPVGYAVLDADLRYVVINERLAEINGRPAEAHLGRTVREVVPAVADVLEAAFRGVMTSGRPLRELEISGEVAGAPGVRHWVESVYPVRDPAGQARGVAVLVWEVTDRVRADTERARLLAAEREAVVHARAAVRRTRMLQEVTAALAAAVSESDVVDVVVRVARQTLGVDRVCLAELCGRDAPDHLAVVASSGAGPVAVGDRLPLEAAAVMTDVVRHARPVFLPDVVERVARYPHTARADIVHQALAALPLTCGGRVVGVLVLGWDLPRPFADGEQELLAAVATQCATALDRARLYDEAQAGAARMDLLARASAVLSHSLDDGDVLEALVDLLVPDHTDWLVVLVPDGAGRLVPSRSVVGGAEPAARPTVPWRSAVPVAGSSPIAEVFRHQQPLATHDVRGLASEADAADDAAAALPFEPGGALVVPMVVRGRSTGVLCLVDRPGRTPSVTSEADLFGVLARRAAAALDNARLFGQRARIAIRLQETLLPTRLPTIAGAELAVRYATAEEAVEVGGDLYDAFAIDDSSYVLVIGDVSGRGVDAAGTTGLARHTLRAVARDLRPADALRRLNEVVNAHDDERFLTAVCARVTLLPGGGAELTVARAGHPYPVLLRADGTTRTLRPHGPLLGPLDEVAFEEESVRLSPGDALVLYTDGLTEARGAEGLFGEHRLTATLAGLATSAGLATADRLADGLLAAVDAFRSAPADDDVALLVLRLTERPRIA